MRHPDRIAHVTRAVFSVVLALAVVACESESEPPAPAPAPSAPAETESSPIPAAAPGLDAALARGIVPPTLDDGTYRVDPFVAVVLYERLRADLDPFAHVEAEGAAPAGYRVEAIAKDDVLSRLGLQEGDVIEALNGVPAVGEAQLELALDAAENRLTVTIFREDLSFTNSYRFEGGLAWRDVIAGPEPEAAEGAEPVDLVEPEEAEEPDSSPPVARAPKSSAKSGGGRASRPSTPSRPSTNPRPTAPTSTDIRCASASSCTITQRKFDDLRASPSALQSGVDIVPAIRNDVFSGYKLKSVSSRSPVHALGFRSGDKITHVNGRDLTDDAQAMALYWSLGSSKLFKIRYERGGRNLVKTVRVV